MKSAYLLMGLLVAVLFVPIGDSFAQSDTTSSSGGMSDEKMDDDKMKMEDKMMDDDKMKMDEKMLDEMMKSDDEMKMEDKMMDDEKMMDDKMMMDGMMDKNMMIKKMVDKRMEGVKECKAGHELIFKKTDHTPACVKPDTRILLMERGWAISEKAENEHMSMMMQDKRMMMDEKMEKEKMKMEDEKMKDEKMMMEDEKMKDEKMMMEDEKMKDEKMMMDKNMNSTMSINNANMTDGAMMMMEFTPTDEEMTWLVDNPVIKVAYDPQWIPIEYVNDDGDLDGLTSDYITALEEIIGTSFEAVETADWNNALEHIKQGDADVIFMVASTADRMEYMGFTTPHTVLDIDAMMLESNQFVKGIDDSCTDDCITVDDLKDLNVITVKGYAIEAWLDENHSEIKYNSVDSIEAGLKSLDNSTADVFLGVAAVISTQSEGVLKGTLYNAGSIGFAYELSIGYTSEKPELGAILEKGLGAISDEDKMQWLEDRTS